MHLNLIELLALVTHPISIAVLLLLMGFVAVPSGTPVPTVEGLVLGGALLWAPNVLALLAPTFQQLVAGVLLLWVASCGIMVIRFFFSSNWFICWYQPAPVQLMQDGWNRWLKRGT